MLFNKFKYTLLFILAPLCALFAQGGVISVVDADTKQPIEFVHLIYKDGTTQKQYVTTTDANGKAENLAENSSQLIVTFIGYNTIKTTVEPGKDYTFQLEMGSEGLQEVVVTGQYAPVAEGNSVYKVKLLSKEKIESRGAITLNQLLNDQLNIRISQDNVLGSSMTMQGMGDNNIKILIDGVPVTGRLNGNIDLSQINLDNIERVEIIEGPMSVMYGSNALAGTINLITKKPKKNEKSAGAKFYYESVGVYNTDVWANYGGKKSTAKINVGRNFFDGWNPTAINPEEGIRYQQWRMKEQYFGNFSFQREFKAFNVGWTTDGLWENIKVKGNKRSEFSDYAFDNYFYTNRWMNTLNVDVKGIKKHKLNVLGSYTYFDRKKLRYNRNLVDLTQELTANPSDHDTTIFHTVVVRGTLSSGFSKKWNYQIGTDINWEKSAGERLSGNPEIGDYGFYANLKYQPTEKWTIQPALRAAYNTQFSAPLVPSINVQFKAQKPWQMRLSYAHGFRAPSLKELYLFFVDVNHNIQGNPNLQPENSKHFNANFSFRKKFSKTSSIKIEPSLFYNHINDMISLTFVGGDLYTYENIDQYTTWGGKVEVNYGIHPDFDFGLGYSHLAYANRLEEETGTQPFLYTPEFTASFNYWRAQKKFRFNVIYKFTGEVPTFVQNANGDAEQRIMPSYSLLDVTASYALWKNKITVSAGAKNLFDVTNLTVGNGSGGVHSSGNQPINWGRSYFVGLKISI